MKPEDIDNMQAGRELDMLVAERVMREKSPWVNSWVRGGPNPYSTDIAAAWLVVEKLCERQRTITLSSLGVLPDTLRWGCNILRGVRRLETITQAEGDTAPLAICRAALKAVATDREIAPNPFTSHNPRTSQ